MIKAARSLSYTDGIVIIDAPPGTSCPVIASLKGSDFCLLVTEPTPFGLNDLELAIEVVKKLEIPMGVVVNRSDIGEIEARGFCEKMRIPILMEIPEDRRIAEAYSRGELASAVLNDFKRLFAALMAAVDMRVQANQAGVTTEKAS